MFSYFVLDSICVFIFCFRFRVCYWICSYSRPCRPAEIICHRAQIFVIQNCTSIHPAAPNPSQECFYFGIVGTMMKSGVVFSCWQSDRTPLSSSSFLPSLFCYAVLVHPLVLMHLIALFIWKGLQRREWQYKHDEAFWKANKWTWHIVRLIYPIIGEAFNCWCCGAIYLCIELSSNISLLLSGRYDEMQYGAVRYGTLRFEFFSILSYCTCVM